MAITRLSTAVTPILAASKTTLLTTGVGETDNVISLKIGEVSGNASTVDIYINKAGAGDVALVMALAIPANTVVEINDFPMFLTAGDIIKLQADTVGQVTAHASYFHEA